MNPASLTEGPIEQPITRTRRTARAGLLSGLAIGAAGSIAFSVKAIIAKLAYRHGVDAVTLLMLRMLFALPLFVLMALWAGRGQPRLDARQWAGIAGLGFSGYYLASYLDFAGLAYISASLERWWSIRAAACPRRPRRRVSPSRNVRRSPPRRFARPTCGKDFGAPWTGCRTRRRRGAKS